MPNIKVNSLTRGEKLWLVRRRDKENQKDAAKRHNVSLAKYRAWESDKEEGPSVKVGRLKNHEQCALMRKRKRKTLAEVAEDLGCCRFTVHLKENGLIDHDDLIAYWAA